MAVEVPNCSILWRHPAFQRPSARSMEEGVRLVSLQPANHKEKMGALLTRPRKRKKSNNQQRPRVEPSDAHHRRRPATTLPVLRR